MDTTDCLGLPYPECDPPLTEDASDISQLRDLAVATDAAVQLLADSITATLVSPDAVCMTGGVNAAGLDVTHFFSGSNNFDNAGMADSVADGIRIQQDGWYMIGGWVRASLAPQAPIAMRVEPLLNGDPFSSRQGPGSSTSITEAVMWSDMGFFRSGDFLNCMTHHTGNPATVVTYTVEMWAYQVLINV